MALFSPARPIVAARIVDVKERGTATQEVTAFRLEGGGVMLEVSVPEEATGVAVVLTDDQWATLTSLTEATQ